ncbi:MAG: chemotaxis protein CheW [Pseudobdellovibrionaceae bacterium]
MKDMMEDPDSVTDKAVERQFATFWLGNRLYGIDVMKVQEVTNPLTVTKVPLAPPFVVGLINLRGQISTAINLRRLFQMDGEATSSEEMNIVSKVQGHHLSFLVDRIGDVIEVFEKDFEEAPETIPDSIREFMGGVYKIPANLLSVIDVEKITTHIAGNLLE